MKTQNPLQIQPFHLPFKISALHDIIIASDSADMIPQN